MKPEKPEVKPETKKFAKASPEDAKQKVKPEVKPKKSAKASPEDAKQIPDGRQGSSPWN